MAKGTTVLNYLAFLILFITSLVFIFTKNSAILGYILAFLVNTFFIFFIFDQLAENLDDYTYFIPTVSILSVVFSAILHFVSLIFILILIYKLHAKYTKSGLPLTISEPYNTQLYNFNIIMATVFSSCAALVFLLNLRWMQLDINFYELLKHMNIFLFYKNFTMFIALILSMFSLGASIYQVVIISGFSQLSRNQINPHESKTVAAPGAVNNRDTNNIMDRIMSIARGFYFTFF